MMLSMQTSGERLWPDIINSSETFVDLSLVCGTIHCGKVHTSHTCRYSMLLSLPEPDPVQAQDDKECRDEPR